MESRPPPYRVATPDAVLNASACIAGAFLGRSPLLAHLGTRRLYLGEGYSSLFTYCTPVLHISEHAAYGRIEAARAARRYPVVLDLLADGSVTLTTVTLLAPLLTAANHRALLDEARHKSKRAVEHIVARLRPQPPVAATVRGATDVENVELRCRAHNMYEAEQYFGSRLPLLLREAKAAYVMTTRSRPSPARRVRLAAVVAVVARFGAPRRSRRQASAVKRAGKLARDLAIRTPPSRARRR